MAGEDLDVTALIDQVDRLRPDVVLVDTAVSTMPLQEVVAQVRMGCTSAMIIALHDSADSAAILSAFRAGVNEFLYPPFDQALQAALQHKYDQQRGTNPGVRLKGKTIGFLSAKGGCGATTIAAHVAAELGRRGSQLVLLADLDLNNGIIRFLMNSKSSYSILDAMNNLHRLDHSYWKGLVSNGLPGLEIVSGPETMSFKRPEPDQVRPVLKFARSNYEWTIVDLGRGLDPFVLSALEEMDEAYIVLSLDVPSLHQTKQLIKVLVDSGYRRNRIRLICNRIPKQIEMSAEDLEKMLGIPVYAMLPEDYQAVYDAYSTGKLVQPASKLGGHLNRLAMKLAGGAPEDKPKRRFFSFFR
jgi:pilus assembly protein CpaE